jgi:thiol:disulfide interchange protein
MNTSLSTKLTALALALMINSVIMGSMALLFNAQLQHSTVVTALASTAGASANDVA